MQDNFNQLHDLSDVNSRCLAFHLKKASRAITQIYDQALTPCGLRSTQFNILVTFFTLKSPTLTMMAQSLVMDRTTLTRNLKPIEKSGFIEPIQARDKRSKAYSLTELGKATLQKSFPIWLDITNRLEEHLGEESLSLLIGNLKHTLKNISDL